MANADRKQMTKVLIATGLLGVAVLLVSPAPEAAPLEDSAIAQDWNGAIAALKLAALRDPRNADIQSYLGFSYRKSGQLKAAFKHYDRALALNPRHRGAHEYVGEAYLSVNKLSKAEEHLAALEQICLLPCDELEDLKEEIDKYRASLSR